MTFKEDKHVFYRAGYKYQEAKDLHIQTSIFPENDILTKFISLKTNGELIVFAGYAHDGASGPTFDTKSTFRAATAHDALFQLMRLGLLDQKWFIPANEELGRLMIEDLSWWEPELRAKLWVRTLNELGGPAANPANKKPVFMAP